MTLQRGHLLDRGRYQVVRPLGRGGYGCVYLGADTRLGEAVAIKELIPALVDDKATVKRFVQEARSTMRLTHPNLVHTRDVFQEGDNWYAVMDYLPGGSLADRLGRSPMPVDEILRIMADMCAGLTYVHAHGVVHCDIKPSNVLFDERGRATLADFGIAYVPIEFSDRSWRTHSDFAAGTLYYMSPEQTEGVRDDPRVDIYALGALLYEMLAGHRYLEFDTRNTPSAQAKNIDAIKTQMPEPLTGVPSTLNAAVMRALAKNPEERYPDVRALVAVLSHVMPRSMFAPMPTAGQEPKAMPLPAAPAMPVSRHRISSKTLMTWLAGATSLMVIALIVGVLLLGGGGGEPTSTPSPAGATPATAPPSPTFRPPALTEPAETPTPVPAEVVSVQWPVLAGTPIPQPVVAIAPETAAQVTELAQWGQGRINKVALSPIGDLLAVASTLGIYLYDAETLEGVCFIQADTGVDDIAFSPDGATLASGGGFDDNTVRLWQIAGCSNHSETCGSLIRTFEGHTDEVDSVAFAPDGATLASGSWDRTIRIWRVADGSLLQTLVGHGKVVTALAFSPDGTKLASGAEENSLRLWQVADGSLLHILEGHTDRVLTVAFAPDGMTVASGAVDRTVRLWQVTDGTLQRTLEGHLDTVESVSFSPDGTILASGSWDHTVRLWQVADGTLLRTLEGHTDDVKSVAFAFDGVTLASASGDGTVRLWQVADGSQEGILAGYLDWVEEIAFSPDGRTLAAAVLDNTVWLWRVKDGVLLRNLRHPNPVRSIAFSPDGTILASGSQREVRLWRMVDGTLLQILDGPPSSVDCMAFSRDGTLLALGSGYSPAIVQIWQVSDGTLLHTLKGHTHYVKSVAFSPSGNMLASGSQDGTVRLWQVADGELLRILEGGESLAFSPDGSLLAVGAGDGTVRLWRASDGELLRTLQGQTSWVSSVSFSPNGQVLAVGGLHAGTVLLWGVPEGELLHTLEGRQQSVVSVAFSADGTLLTSGAWEGTVQLWGVAP